MIKKPFFILFFLWQTMPLWAQETAVYTNDLKAYYRALELYHNKAYVAARYAFDEVKEQFDKTSDMRANCEYYIANCSIRLGQHNADALMQEFVDKHPNSAKRSDAFMEVANYYYNHAQYAYALKWLQKRKSKNLTGYALEDYLFKYGYALFATKNYTASKKYFVQLLDSPQHGVRAKYYYGYIAYKEDDYDNANKYLSEVSQNTDFQKDVSYYMADINFKSGNFQKAIDAGLPLLATAKPREKSEINKIIGESYFNLKKYDKAIPYLKEYKGKRNKWINTDYYLLGYAYYQQLDFENAVAHFNKIIDGKNAVAQNAYYHLAECYLELDKKPQALNAFRNASEMDFSPDIREDAYLNYAKLSYEIGNPYKNVPEVLQDFIKTYPDSSEKNTINSLIISSYMLSKDYEGLLSYLEKDKEKEIVDKKSYQKAAFLKGVALFNKSKYHQAVKSFEQSLTHPVDKELAAQSIYWKGEAHYLLRMYEKALEDYLRFKTLQNATNEEKQHIDYQIAYTYLKLKKYEQGATFFKSYLDSGVADPVKKKDSYLRLGDAYFVSSSYPEAIEVYKNSEKLRPENNDYAQFQEAMSYGFLNNKKQKISILQKLITTYPKSAYHDDALYVLGSTFATTEPEKAIATYDRLLKKHRQSPFVPRALLKKGLIFYNANKYEQALTTLKEIVNRYPKTPIAQEAVRNARRIYVDTGRVDEYATWVKGLDFIDISNAELDNDMYESAEKQFVSGAYGKAINAFKKYLKNFPSGLHTLKAHFYTAQALESQNRNDETLAHYQYISEQPPNEYTEQALSRLSQLYLNQNKWNEAVPLLKRLEQMAEHTQNVVYAQSNLMKAYYQKEAYTQAVDYAEKVLNNPGVDDAIKSDANIIIARSAIKTGNADTARKAYAKVKVTATGELKAEALYYDAYFKHQDGDYRNSNAVVQTIAAEYPAYKYWGAKGLLIMAKNFYALNDAYQATYILKSIIKNFKQYDDVLKEAKEELSNIKTKEAETNDSVVPE